MCYIVNMSDEQTHSADDLSKDDKKRAKSEAKAAKKQAKADKAAVQAEAEQVAAEMQAGQEGGDVAGDSPAERSARAAEEKVRLERWRVVFGALAALAALAGVLFGLSQGC